jgi:hypothetical protein
MFGFGVTDAWRGNVWHLEEKEIECDERFCFTKAVGLFVFTMVSFSAASAQQCTGNRWEVRIGSDAEARGIDLLHPQARTISELSQLSRPSTPLTSIRAKPVETMAFEVNAVLMGYKIESKNLDYYLVLGDKQGNTMVARIPAPECIGASNPFRQRIAKARLRFEKRFRVTSTFQESDTRVRVTGIGFFNLFHNQRGEAPNVLELTPVLDIVFTP